MKTKPYGRCRICGNEGQLSKEHIPPQGAENRGKVIIIRWVERLGRFQEVARQGSGSHVFTSCKTCNTLSNEKQYDKAYIDFVQQFLRIFSPSASTGSATVQFSAKIDRRGFIKRVMFQFLATNQFPLDLPEVKALRESILNPDAPLALFGRVFLYAQPASVDRFTGIFGKNDGTHNFVAQELATFPIATLWDLLGNLPTRGLYDISSWASAPRGESQVFCPMAVQPVTYYLPMEFADQQEMAKRQYQNMLDLLKPFDLDEAREVKSRVQSLKMDLVNPNKIVVTPRDRLLLQILNLTGEWANS